MRETKTEAKTIQDAVEKGLTEMGLRRDQVEVVVVSEGKSGFLGFGAKKACVILREKRWTSGGDEPRGGGSRGGRDSRGGRGGSRGGSRDGRGGSRGGNRGGGEGRSGSAAPRRPGRYGYEDARLPPPEETHSASESHYENRRPSREDRPRMSDRVYKEESLAPEYINIQPAQDPIEHVKTALLKILSLMGMQGTVTEARLDQAENLLFIRFDCPDSASFTAENGRGLQALQFLLNSIVSRKREPHLALRLDTGGYWDSKEKEIAQRVEEAVKEVKANNRPYSLDPMPASMRKIVHNIIKTAYPDMETASAGEGRWRKVVISQLNKPAEQPAQAAQPVEAAQPAEAAQPVEAAQPAEQTTEQK